MNCSFVTKNLNIVKSMHLHTLSAGKTMKAVILAGGRGKRLRPLTDSVPKPLIEVRGKPIIVWQIEWLKSYGINEFIVCVGYLKEKIINYLGDGSEYGVRIGYVVERKPLGTGGAIKNAEVFLRNESGFFVINGDIITTINPEELTRLNSRHIGAIALVPLRSPYGIVEFDDDLTVRSFMEKPLLRDYWINAGVYYFKPDIFRYLPIEGDIERTAFPNLAKFGLLKAVKYENAFWRSIDTMKDLDEVSRLLGEKSVVSKRT